MMLHDPLALFSSAAERYGQIVHLPAAQQHFYLLNHPDYFKHVLQEHYRNYEKGTSYKKLKRLLGEGLATSEGSYWLRQRRLAQPAFHHQRLAAMATLMIDATAGLIERWQPRAANNERVDITAEMMGLTQQIIVSTMFSTSIGDDTARVCQAFNTALKYLNSSIWMSALPDRLNPGHRRFEAALDTLNSVIYRIIGERRRSENNQSDLLAMLLHARDAESGEAMNDQQLRDEMMTIFSAGHETTATTLAWTWHMLAQYPDVEQRLHAELAAVLGGRAPTVQDLPQLTYTRMVIEEVLRLYPAAWALLRSPVINDVIGGYCIEAGSVVMMSPYVLHRTPAFWENPERFDPERFTPERVEARPAYTYVPFGGGPRLCIGKGFAMMEAQLVLSMVAQRYQLRGIPGHSLKPAIEVVLRPHPGTLMLLYPRST